MMNLAISGAHGRMGQAIIKLAVADDHITVRTLLEHPDHPKCSEAVGNIAVHGDNSQIKGCDALIEFTLPDGTMKNLDAARTHGVPMVIGTTGFTDDQLAKIQSTAETIPIVFASNMSIGVNILFKLIEITGGAIGATDISLSETHHIHKKDKPSGTAKTMAELAEKSSGRTVSDIEAIREGEVIGDHTIRFESDEDVLTISHHAKDRSMFAKGAITAAKFLKNKKSGLFTMQDVLGLNAIR